MKHIEKASKKSPRILSENVFRAVYKNDDGSFTAELEQPDCWAYFDEKICQMVQVTSATRVLSRDFLRTVIKDSKTKLIEEQGSLTRKAEPNGRRVPYYSAEDKALVRLALNAA